MPTAQIQRVLLTGDVHGNTQWLIGHVLQQAQKQDCQLVLQLGVIWRSLRYVLCAQRVPGALSGGRAEDTATGVSSPRALATRWSQ